MKVNCKLGGLGQDRERGLHRGAHRGDLGRAICTIRKAPLPSKTIEQTKVY